jgi:predicted transcriptional regulator
MLQNLPSDTLLEPVLLEDFEVSKADPLDPQGPYRKIESSIQDADRVRWCTPILTRQAIQLISKKVTNSHTNIELILPKEIWEDIRSTDHDALKTIENHEGCSV